MDKGADINIIEHVWAACEDYLYKNLEYIKNKQDVFNFTAKYFFSEECKIYVKSLFLKIYNRVK